MGIEKSEIPRLEAVFNIEHPELLDPEIPKHTVKLSSFYIDKYLVTNADFRCFVDANPQWQRDRIPTALHNGKYLRHWKGNSFPAAKANHPVVNVSWYAAESYCQSLGKRLPTEAEWEYAARGGLKAPLFPWGDDPINPDRANYSASMLPTTRAVGSYPANGYGLFDMAGNVWEYTIDEWKPYSSNPAGKIETITRGFLENNYLNITSRRVIRGGSWGGAPINLWVEYRDSHPPDGAQDFVGFRCAQGAQ